MQNGSKSSEDGRPIGCGKDSEGRQQSIPVDLGKIVKRETEDVTLRPSDILYIPDSHTKAALIRASEIALAVGTSLVIYRIGTQ